MIRRFRAYLRQVLGTLTRLADAVQAIPLALEALPANTGAADQELADLARRLDAIERDRARWEAEVEGMIIKGEARFKAARAAEERARHLAKRTDEEEEDEFEDEDAPRGRAEGVPAMHQVLEMDPTQPAAGRPLSKRERARQLKYSRL